MSLPRELLQTHSKSIFSDILHCPGFCNSVLGSSIFVAQEIKGTSFRKPLGQWLQSHTKEEVVAAGSDLKYDYQSR